MDLQGLRAGNARGPSLLDCVEKIPPHAEMANEGDAVARHAQPHPPDDSPPLSTASKISKLRRPRVPLAATQSGRSLRETMKGTFCSPRPPCERRRWPAKPERSGSARVAPTTVP